jgi:hypothetical protein
MHYCAVRYAYGEHVVNNGQRADEVHRFPSWKARADWLADGPDYSTESGYRAIVRLSSDVVRQAKRNQAIIEH